MASVSTRTRRSCCGRRTSRARLAGLLLAGLLSAPPALGADWVFGMSAAFSGPSAGLGIELYRGARAYLDQVEAAGGVHGRKLRVIARDDGYDPSRAIANTLAFLADPEVLALFSYVGTPTTTRVLPLLKLDADRALPMLFPFTGARPLRGPPYGAFVLNLRASYQQETAGLVEQLAAIGLRRIAVFYQADSYGRSGWAGVRSAVASHDAEMVAEASYRRGDRLEDDYGEQVAILRVGRPDAVIAIGAYAACAGFVRDARDAGLDVPIANVSFVGSESLLSALAQAGARSGRDYTRRLVNSQVVPSYEDASLPAVREYRELMDRHDPRPDPRVADPAYPVLRYSFVSFEGFLNAKLLVEVLRRAGPDADPTRLLRAAEALRDYDLGIGTPVGFGPDDHQALERVYFTTVADGRFVPLRSWNELLAR